MPETTTAAASDRPGRRHRRRRNESKLRNGVMKRGNTWSYVIRVKNPETGVSRPRWVGGFATEEAAKEARDQARVQARRGEYIDRNSIIVTAYLDDWIESTLWKSNPAPCSTGVHAWAKMSAAAVSALRMTWA